MSSHINKHCSMDQPMTNQESYIERRQLFKNVWETAMHLDVNEPDIMTKPKLIRTLRLDEVDRCVAGKRKKHRIKNLRAVCNKILDFCDRQEADDMFYEQMTANGQELPQNKAEQKTKKQKLGNGKKKVRKAASIHTRDVIEITAAVSPEREDDTSRDLGTMTLRKNSLVKPALALPKNSETLTKKKKSSSEENTQPTSVPTSLPSGLAERKFLKPLRKKKNVKENEITGDARLVSSPGTLKYNFNPIIGRTSMGRNRLGKLLPIATVQIQ